MRVNSELMDAQLETKASDVTPASTAKGLIYHKSTTEPIKVSDGTNVHKVLTDRIMDVIEINQSQVEPNYELSADISDSTSNTSYEDVTGASVTITTTGKPVEITLVNSHCVALGASVPAIMTVKALRDATDVSEIILAATGPTNPYIQVPSGAFRWVDSPAAGTYTYKLQYKVNSASATGTVQGKLFVKEIV